MISHGGSKSAVYACAHRRCVADLAQRLGGLGVAAAAGAPLHGRDADAASASRVAVEGKGGLLDPCGQFDVPDIQAVDLLLDLGRAGAEGRSGRGLPPPSSPLAAEGVGP